MKIEAQYTFETLKENEELALIFNKQTVVNYTKKLYVRVCINRKPLNRILVDNDVAINVVPLRVLMSLGKTE